MVARAHSKLAASPADGSNWKEKKKVIERSSELRLYFNDVTCVCVCNIESRITRDDDEEISFMETVFMRYLQKMILQKQKQKCGVSFPSGSSGFNFVVGQFVNKKIFEVMKLVFCCDIGLVERGK